MLQPKAAPTGHFWHFIHRHRTQSAEIAQIKIDTTTTLEANQSQTITGTGTLVVLDVRMGNATAIKVQSNPNNQKDCTWPMVSAFSTDDSEDLFQIACAGQKTDWTIAVYFSIHHHPENPPTSADVTLLVDGAASEQVPEGQFKTYYPSGTTLAFQISNWTGPGSIKICKSPLKADGPEGLDCEPFIMPLPNEMGLSTFSLSR